MRVAIVRDSDVSVRGSDTVVRASDIPNELLEAIVAAGHATTEVPLADAIVIVLTAGGRGLADRSVSVPCVAVIARTDPSTRGFDEEDRSSLETWADAYVRGSRAVADAIAWVAAEDRAQRTRGQPRLTVIGTNNDDFGMSRMLAADPMILGRAMSFGQHPQRPDRMPTPTGSIARIHARARSIDGVVGVCDTRSTNGTLVIRQGQPARLLCPQQDASGRKFGPPATDWLIRDPTPDYVELSIGDQLQLPGWWRFRVDGDASWRPDD